MPIRPRGLYNHAIEALQMKGVDAYLTRASRLGPRVLTSVANYLLILNTSLHSFLVVYPAYRRSSSHAVILLKP